MNITIKITYWGGTVMDVSIPIAIEAARTVQQEAPAVVTPDEVHVASEPAIPAASAPSCVPNDEEIERAYHPDEILPGKKRYKSVADMVEAFESSRENTLGKERVGEEGEGDGRIGGVGERKEEGGEGEGGEENLEQFQCTDGLYALPPNLYSDFCAAFGQPTVDRELLKARLWMECNPTKRKTRRGMSRYLNAWLCRAQGEKRQPLKGRSGSLLEASNTSQAGW